MRWCKGEKHGEQEAVVIGSMGCKEASQVYLRFLLLSSIEFMMGESKLAQELRGS